MNPILLAVLIVTAVGVLCAVMLVIASKFLSIPVDQKESDLRDALPGVNCGACGFSGCDGYAKALASGECEEANRCVPGADAVAQRIAQILGVKTVDVIEKIAVVHCNGTCDASHEKLVYDGIPSCAAVKMLHGGPNACQYGCLGFGDCAAVCPQDAICIENGVARVDTRKCIGCGLCARTCPNHVIEIVPDIHKVAVSCSNTDKGAVARKKCTNACIGCRKCELGCPVGAIKVENNLARVDYEACTSCGKCAENCPVHCIRYEDFRGIYHCGNE